MTKTEYLITYDYLVEKIYRLDQRIEKLASNEKYVQTIKNMGCFLGVKTHTALSMILEIGDFYRFEKAQSYTRGNIGHKSLALKQRQTGCDPEIIAYVDKANERLRRKFYRMTLNKGINRNIATTAVARELACFIWGMATGNIS